MKEKKNLIFIVLFAVVSIFFLCLIIYFSIISKTNPTTRREDLIVNFNPKNFVLLKNELPLSDVVGKGIKSKTLQDDNFGYIEMSIRNISSKKVKYDIYLKKEAIKDLEIKENYIKLYLTKDNKKLKKFDLNGCLTFNELEYMIDFPENKLLYEDFIEPNGEVKYVLRTWLSDSYALTKKSAKFKFLLDLRVK